MILQTLPVVANQPTVGLDKRYRIVKDVDNIIMNGNFVTKAKTADSTHLATGVITEKVSAQFNHWEVRTRVLRKRNLPSNTTINPGSHLHLQRD